MGRKARTASASKLCIYRKCVYALLLNTPNYDDDAIENKSYITLLVRQIKDRFFLKKSSCFNFLSSSVTEFLYVG